MYNPMLPAGFDFVDPGLHPVEVHGLELLARLLLDLAGLSFLLILLVFVVLNAYGAACSLRGDVGATGRGPTAATLMRLAPGPTDDAVRNPVP
ncbi:MULTISPECIES: hypothetical protein [Actinomyces]|uniref:hypothetical protein n=1 Tax=Actinomyces TaxID=1654 RepID=UPI0011C7A53F|nr:MULTISPECIES: hypothetical protein [Actinomyces]